MFPRIELSDFYLAYRKLKSMVYYDSGGLELKREIAEFESSIWNGNENVSFKSEFLKNMKPLFHALNSDKEALSHIAVSTLLNQVSYRIAPKSFTDDSAGDENKDKDSVKFYSNDIENKSLYVDNYNLMVQAPVEVYILSTLWVMKVAIMLEEQIPNSNYANRLSINPAEKNDDTSLDGLMLYRPYFTEYQKWLDNGLIKTGQLLDEGNNCALVSLDIKRFFYSVRMNVASAFRDIIGKNRQVQALTGILQAVHLRHADKIQEYTPVKISSQDINDGNVPLPVGLPSSGWLANYYLHEFDNKVLDDLNPAYYGRYVDDMIFVISCQKMVRHNKAEQMHNFIKKFFIDTGLIQLGENGECYEMQVGTNRLKIQGKKIIIQYFRHNASRALLNKFKKNVDRNRSEFRYLPFENMVNVEFDDEAISMEYSDSVNKLRSVKSISNNKFGASTYLAHKIFLALSNTSPSKSESKERLRSSVQILSFFRGKTALEMNSLWEKVITYFLLIRDFNNLRKFCNQIESTIHQIKPSNINDCHNIPNHIAPTVLSNIASDMIEVLFRHLQLSMSMAFSLCPDLVKSEVRHADCHNYSRNGHYSYDEILSISLQIRKSLLFRQNYVKLPGIGFTEYNNDRNDITEFPTTHLDMLKIKKTNGEISPVFLHFHHFNLLNVLSTIGAENQNPACILNDAYETYIKFNYEWRGYKPKNRFFNIKPDEGNKDCTRPDIFRIDVFDNTSDKGKPKNWPDKLIGLANMWVNPKDCEDALRHRFKLDKQHRDTLFELLNYANRHSVELTVFPEVSIPIQLLPLLTSQCSSNNLAIITGINYIVINHKAFNYTMTLLPVRTKHYTTCVILPRLKNYLAPAESDLINGLRLKVPKIRPRYDLIHWRGVYFSVYNCFEMSNLSDRALFKSDVDFIIATEYNKDINYYSNVVESWVRDLHCFIIQVNTSEYGDSRVTLPKSSAMMNSMQVSGGKCPVMLIDRLDINGIRYFQEHTTSWQINSICSKEKYKPTPANFNHASAVNRRKNKPVT